MFHKLSSLLTKTRFSYSHDKVALVSAVVAGATVLTTQWQLNQSSDKIGTSTSTSANTSSTATNTNSVNKNNDNKNNDNNAATKFSPDPGHFLQAWTMMPTTTVAAKTITTAQCDMAAGGGSSSSSGGDHGTSGSGGGGDGGTIGGSGNMDTTNAHHHSHSHFHQQQQQQQLHGDDVHGDPNDDDGTFWGQCLQRQIFRPKLPYPAWDYDWDHRETEATSQAALSAAGQYAKSKTMGKTRHLLLIRHGQYDERYKDDRRRKLTPLGRHQAELTGQRLAVLARGGLGTMKKEFAGPLNIKCIHVSDMERAKETARIIASHLPHVKVNHPDPMLNEALPAPMIPIRPDIRAVREIDANHSRIEAAFQKYVHRADLHDDHHHHQNSNSDAVLRPQSNSSHHHHHDATTEHLLHHEDPHTPQDPTSPHVNLPHPEHEFEILVGHGNIIRYFFCRALQLPPEAWLRISTFNCSITYLMIYPNGYVSCRMLGDVGHLGYDNTTFSGSYGYNW